MDGNPKITDAPPEIAVLFHQRIMALSGEERFMMGVRLFEAARDMVIASMPTDLSPEEFKRQLFQRIYGEPLPF
jgi:hypothetical protein